MNTKTDALAQTTFTLLLFAILTGWPGTLQIHGPGGTGFIFDGSPESSIHKRPLLFEGDSDRGK